MATQLDIYVDAPPISPPRGGLLAVADLHQVTDVHFGTGSIAYTPAACAMPALAPQDCWTTIGPTAGGSKTTDGIPDVVLSANFNLYSAVECFTDWGSSSEYADRARSQLQRGQGYAIARQLAVFLAAEAAVIPAAGIGSYPEAIGVLEQYAGARYPGLPLIHADRNATARLSAQNLVVPGLDWTVTTIQGTPVANDAGYGNTDGSSSGDLFVTGAVHIWLGPITASEAFNHTLNRQVALAERRVGLSVDCFAGRLTYTPADPPVQEP